MEEVEEEAVVLMEVDVEYTSLTTTLTITTNDTIQCAPFFPISTPPPTSLHPAPEL